MYSTDTNTPQSEIDQRIEKLRNQLEKFRSGKGGFYIPYVIYHMRNVGLYEDLTDDDMKAMKRWVKSSRGHSPNNYNIRFFYYLSQLIGDNKEGWQRIPPIKKLK